MDKTLARTIGIANLTWLLQQPKLKSAKEDNLYRDLFASDYWQLARTVAITKSLPIEMDTTAILHAGWESGKAMLLPKTSTNRLLTFHEVSPETRLKKTKFGVEEPLSDNIVHHSAIDLVIVPGIIYTLDGHRVGFGGGYYDRFLSTYQGGTCSLVFSEQIQEHWPIESFDQPVQQLFIN